MLVVRKVERVQSSLTLFLLFSFPPLHLSLLAGCLVHLYLTVLKHTHTTGRQKAAGQRKENERQTEQVLVSISVFLPEKRERKPLVEIQVALVEDDMRLQRAYKYYYRG